MRCDRRGQPRRRSNELSRREFVEQIDDKRQRPLRIDRGDAVHRSTLTAGQRHNADNGIATLIPAARFPERRLEVSQRIDMDGAVLAVVGDEWGRIFDAGRAGRDHRRPASITR